MLDCRLCDSTYEKASEFIEVHAKQVDEMLETKIQKPIWYHGNVAQAYAYIVTSPTPITEFAAIDAPPRAPFAMHEAVKGSKSQG